MTSAVRRAHYLPARMQRLRRAVVALLVGHPDPLRLIDALAGMASERDKRHRDTEAALRRDLEDLKGRVSELYVDASIVGTLTDAYDRRRPA